MDAKKATIISSSAIISLLILLVLFWLTLGTTKPFFILAGLCFAFVLILFVWILTQYSALDYRRRLSILRRASIERRELRQEYSFLRKVAGLPTKFRYEALAAATDNFQSIIGHGSSASVFKGILDDGTPVAVKCIDQSAERGEREFRSEVSAIASTQHVNLVRLLGYCPVSCGQRYLVYEFVAKGSLNQWIFPRRRGGGGGTSHRRGGRREEENEKESEEQYLGTITQEAAEKCLPWGYRYRVAIDVAKALSYLHHDCRHRILHLDVKPENILLDENFRARVADFGLSKLMNRDESRVMSTVRGTKGYLAPEWLLGRGVSEKSDIYSYGMVLLELVSGRRNVRLVGKEDGGDWSQRRWSYFPKIVAEKVREGKEMDVVDQRLMIMTHRSHDLRAMEKEVKALLYVGLWCIQKEPKLRPNMARVVDMLEGRMPILSPPETEMVTVDLLGIHEPSQRTTPLGHLDGLRAPPMSSSSFAGSTMSPR